MQAFFQNTIVAMGTVTDSQQCLPITSKVTFDLTIPSSSPWLTPQTHTTHPRQLPGFRVLMAAVVAVAGAMVGPGITRLLLHCREQRKRRNLKMSSVEMRETLF